LPVLPAPTSFMICLFTVLTEFRICSRNTPRRSCACSVDDDTPALPYVPQRCPSCLLRRMV
jgi:hypothetical protein